MARGRENRKAGENPNHFGKYKISRGDDIIDCY